MEFKWNNAKKTMTEHEKKERLRLTRVIEARLSRLAKKFDDEFLMDITEFIFDSIKEKQAEAKKNSGEARILDQLSLELYDKLKTAGDFVPKSLKEHLNL